MKFASIVAALLFPLALAAGEPGKEPGHQDQGHHFGRADTNHDGMISNAEAEANAPGLAEKFTTLDDNKDGNLSHEELERHGQDMRSNMHERMDEKFKAADKNGDGKLTAEEAKQGMPRVANDFAAVDANRDGVVSRDEIRNRAEAKRRDHMEHHDDMHGDKHGPDKSASDRPGNDKPGKDKPQ